MTHLELLQAFDVRLALIISGSRKWDMSDTLANLEILDSFRHLRDTFLTPPTDTSAEGGSHE